MELRAGLANGAALLAESMTSLHSAERSVESTGADWVWGAGAGADWGEDAICGEEIGWAGGGPLGTAGPTF